MKISNLEKNLLVISGVVSAFIILKKMNEGWKYATTITQEANQRRNDAVLGVR